jgi:hypothetical protein
VTISNHNGCGLIVLTTCSAAFAVLVRPLAPGSLASLFDDYDDALGFALDVHRKTGWEVTDECGPFPGQPLPPKDSAPPAIREIGL